MNHSLNYPLNHSLNHPPSPERRLADLSLGETSTITRILPDYQGSERRRLMDMGIVPGTTITAELQSASGDPIAYRVRGALIALRKEQAQLIAIAPAKNVSP
jgi:DtxR family Mn-dependent transcriptional regulator